MPESRPRQYDLIAFDWDGTLFDSTKIIVRCIQKAVADVGGAVPSDRAAAYVIGMGLMEALARQGLKRMFLHAWRLQFDHPASAERIALQAPLPPELQKFHDHVRASAPIRPDRL